MFSLTAAIFLIVDAGTGGKFKDLAMHKVQYGTWSPNLLFLFWTVSGTCYGMVELIRRVIPVDIVGGDVDKLRRMDAIVHIFYEIAGTGGAFASSSAISRRVLGNPPWSQFIVGGSNLGELLGALSVLMLSDIVPTPLPWLRLDAVALNLVWVVPAFARSATPDVAWAWKVAGCFIPISMGWAAGEVSLAAYIQSVLSESAFHHERVSALGSVMAFLYITYIVLYAVLSVALGHVIDDNKGDIFKGLTTVGGVHFSICCVIILASTFVPKGAFSFNPKALGTITTGVTRDQSDSELGSIHGRKDDRDFKEGVSISRGNVPAIYD
ncbi:hypothetical protein H1R20_g15594, partial [Candolleomyces eurysporus]